MADMGHNGGPPMMQRGEGWVAIHRSMRDHWLVGFGQPVKPMDPEEGSLSRAEAWIDLIMECRYEAGSVNNGGRKMEIKPGQLVGAISWLAARWNWTPQTVRTFLDKLEEDGMITRTTPGTNAQNNMQKGKQATVISVCNYSEYQISKPDKQQEEQQANNTQATCTQHASNNNNKDNKETKEQVSTPLPPVGGDNVPSAFEMFGEAPPVETKAAAVKREIAEAFAVYNVAAKHFGLSECRALTDARQKRLGKRLTDIGGLEGFKVALRSLARDEPFTRFLLGKIPPRPNEQPFKLDIDRLLQTDGNLGDVLARLSDIANQSTQPRVQAEPWAGWSRDEWREQITKHANGVWPRDKIGFWPGHPKCAAPPDLIDEMQRDGVIGRYNKDGFCKEKH